MPENSSIATAKWPWKFAIILMLFLFNSDLVGVNIALPLIANNFNITLKATSWIITSNTLSLTILAIFTEHLGRKYGRIRLFSLGSFVFITSALLSGLATNHITLICGRVLQGVAFSLVLPQILAFFSKTTNQLIALIGFSIAISPLINGYLLNLLGWRAIFLFNVIIACLAALLSVWSKKFNYEVKFSDFKINLIKILEVLRCKNYIIALTIRGFFIYGVGTILFITSLYLQNVLDYNVLQTSVVYLSITLVIGVIAPLANKFASYTGERLPLVMGLAFFTIANYLFTQISLTDDIINWVVPLILVGIGFGVAIRSSLKIAMEAVPEDLKCLATNLFMVGNFFAWTTGVYISSGILVKVSKNRFFEILQGAGIKLPKNQHSVINYLYAGAHSSHSVTTQLQGIIIHIAHKAFIIGQISAMSVCTVLTLIAAGLCLFIRAVEKT